MKLRISAAVRMPPSGFFLMFSLPDSSLVSTSFSSRSAAGCTPSSVAMRSTTSLRRRSVKWSEDLAGLVALQVHQDGGDDLRVLVADQLGHRWRVHPLQAFDAGGVACRPGCGSAATTPCRRRAPWSARWRMYSSESRPTAKSAVRSGRGSRPAPPPAARAGTLFMRRHGGAQLLHLARAEVFHHLGRLVLAEREHQDRALLYADCHSLAFTHVLTTLATMRRIVPRQLPWPGLQIVAGSRAPAAAPALSSARASLGQLRRRILLRRRRQGGRFGGLVSLAQQRAQQAEEQDSSRTSAASRYLPACLASSQRFRLLPPAGRSAHRLPCRRRRTGC